MAKPKRKFLLERWPGNTGFRLYVTDIADCYKHIKNIEGVMDVMVIGSYISVAVNPLYDIDEIEAEIRSLFEVPDVFK